MTMKTRKQYKDYITRSEIIKNLKKPAYTEAQVLGGFITILLISICVLVYVLLVQHGNV